MMLASSPPFDGRKGSWPAPVPHGAFAAWNRYICIVGEVPSAGVDMFALSMWLPSGPVEGSAPSRAFARRGSLISNAPLADVNPNGDPASQSWKLLTKKNTCVTFWFLFSVVVDTLVGFQVQTKVPVHAPGGGVPASDGT